MPSALRPTRINVDLQHYKEPWLAYCRAHGTTPSEAFRLVVAKLTNPPFEQKEAFADDDGKVRREVRLSKAELNLAVQIAEREGFCLNRWIAALVRARLEATPQLGQYELEALARSNLQVLAIGRNLNQIAKAFATSGVVANERYAEIIHEVRLLIDEHAKKVSAVLSANVKRWSTK